MAFNKLLTKELMNFLRRYQQLGEYRTQIQNIELTELKKVLATREHIPNKKENTKCQNVERGKIMRRNLSKLSKR